MVSKTTRKFKGKTYYLFDWCQTGEEVVWELKELRSGGYLARCTKAKEGWHVWCRNK